MRFMMMMPAVYEHNAPAYITLPADAVEQMTKYDQPLPNAGVMLTGQGLHRQCLAFVGVLTATCARSPTVCGQSHQRPMGRPQTDVGKCQRRRTLHLLPDTTLLGILHATLY